MHRAFGPPCAISADRVEVNDRHENQSGPLSSLGLTLHLRLNPSAGLKMNTTTTQDEIVMIASLPAN